MTAKTRQLMAACEQLYNAFNPLVQTLDAYIYDALGDCDSADADPDKKFLKQVLYSCTRYEPGLKAFLKHFFYDNAASVLRTDYNMYMIMLCLALFRIDDLGMDNFGKFAMCQEPTKMAAFLDYVFDTSDNSPIMCTVKQEWCKHYDVVYVEQDLIGKIRQLEPFMTTLKEDLINKAQGMVAAAAEKKAAAGITALAKKKLTVPQGPNITKPRPRRVPEPMKITNGVKRGVEPTYLDKTSLEEIESEKRDRLEEVKRETQRKYEDTSGNREGEFRFHETRSNIEKVRREVEEKRAEELQFDASHRKPLPDFTRYNATVKLNTAAILREDALFTKKQAAEAQLIKNYESELRDSTEYYRWKTEMEEHDNQMKLEQVKLKRMQAVASGQNARDALERQYRDNKDVADLIKEEGELMGEQLKIDKEANLLMNKQLVKEIREVEEKAPRKAEAKVFRERQAVRQAQKVELQDAWERKVAEDEVEQSRKLDRIRQLRAHTVHKVEVKVFDPTTTAGLGLLDEMSLVEMEERYKINKQREETEEIEKRKAIVAERAQKQAQLSKRIENITRIREAAKESNRLERLHKKEAEAKKAELEETARNIAQVHLAEELNLKREARKKEMQELVDEEERRKKNLQFQGAAKHHVEEMHFDQLLKGAEREAKARQETAKKAAEIYEQTKITARKVVEKQAKDRTMAKAKLFKQKDEEIKESRHHLVVGQKAEVAQKKFKFAETRLKEKEIKAKLVDRNVYAESINQMSLNLAKTHKMQQTRELQKEAAASKRNVVSMLMS
jgi:hypothetical protein